MSDNQTIGVDIVAKVEGLMTGLSQGLGGITNFTDKAGAAFGGLGATIAAVKGPLMALGGLLAGGALFKHTIDATKSWVEEVKSLAFALGTTRENAAAYAKVMHDLGIEKEKLTTVAQLVTTRIAANAAGFEALGIKVRDARTGAMLPAIEVIQTIAKRSAEMSNEGQKQAFLAEALGRGWRNFASVLKLTEERIREAKAELRHFGIVTTKESEQQVEAYKVSMNRLGEAMEAVQVHLGMRMIPTLTEFAKKLSNMAVDVFPYVMAFVEGFIVGLDAMIVGLRVLWSGFKEALDIVWRFAQAIGVVAKALVQFLHGDYTDSWETLRTGFDQVWEGIKKDAVRNGKAIEDAVAGFAKRASEAMARAQGRTPTKLSGEADKPAKGGTFSTLDSKGLMENAKRALAEMTRNLGKLTLEQEEAFWSHWAALAKAGGLRTRDAYDEISMKLAEITEKLNLRRVKDVEDGLAVEQAYHAKSAKAKFEAANESFLRTRELLGSEHQVTKDAYQRLLIANAEFIAEERDQMAARSDFSRDVALERLNIEEAHSEAMASAGVTSREAALVAQAEFEQRRYDLQVEALMARIALYSDDEQKVEEYWRQIEMLTTQHGGKLASIQDATFAEQKRSIDAFLQPAVAAFDGFFQAIVSGAGGAGKAFRVLMAGLAKTVIQSLSQMVQAQIMASAQTTATKTAEATTVGTANAVEGATGAAAAVAATPFAGPALAAAAFGAMMGLLMGAVGMIASASGGYDLGNENPITQLHRREMVLPAHLADRVRNMTDEPQGRGGDTFVANVTAVDARGLKEMLRSNSRAFREFMREEQRAGRL